MSTVSPGAIVRVRALKLVRRLAQPEARASLYCLTGQLFLVEGQLDRASRWLQRALALFGDAVAPEARPWAQRLLADVDLSMGRPQAAQARLEPILSSADQHDTAFMLPSLAWAHLQQGRLADAERVATAAAARARAERNRLALVDALRVRAMTAMAQERWDEAHRALDDGLNVARRSQYRPAEERLLGVYRELHERTDGHASGRARTADGGSDEGLPHIHPQS